MEEETQLRDNPVDPTQRETRVPIGTVTQLDEEPSVLIEKCLQ